MLKIVSNTTPLISLLKIEKLTILEELYGRIIIPQEVYNELESGKHKDYYIDLTTLNWIEIKSIENRKALSYLMDLDKGEAETIILAKEIKADLVIIDERVGRYYAKNANLKITGTLGVLLKAKNEGILKAIKPHLTELKEKGIWLSDTLIADILTLSKEN